MRARVLLADDHEWILQDMEDLLSPEFDIVCKVGDGLAAVDAAARYLPDLIVTDLSMPGLTGMEASRILLTARPETPIVLVTMHLHTDVLERALSIGIRGFVNKVRADQELLPASRAALRGEIFVSASCGKLQ
jgi:DNA-binding NarL/FixJ family response regulator